MRDDKSLPKENEFKRWLQEERSFSKKVSSDYASRCRRIQRELQVDLAISSENQNDYIEIMKRIKQYSEESSKSNLSAYRLTASLRTAFKNYALYVHGDKVNDYPNGYFMRTRSHATRDDKE